MSASSGLGASGLVHAATAPIPPQNTKPAIVIPTPTTPRTKKLHATTRW